MDRLVSVVTPTLDRREMLRGTLDSIAAQSYGAIEHIVVDGGSRDGTLDLLEQRRDPRVRWTSEPDDGVYDAVNKGLRMARGDYVCYVNSDDRLFPYALAVAVAAFEAAPSVAFVYGDLVTVDAATGRGTLKLLPPFDRHALFRGRLIGQPAAFWRRDLHERIGFFDTALTLAADMEFWMRAAEDGEVRHVSEVLAWELHHPQRLTSGAGATRRAVDELARAVARHAPAPTPAQRAKDRVTAGFFHRWDLLRFLLLRAVRARRGAWSEFRSDRMCDVDVARALMAFIPLAGRRFKDFVHRCPTG
ncbi:MAG: glycosyltransferase [Actinomycetota bacterium]|nr:glycosyltransferase [Actinomycetota bacterium]